MSRQSSLTLTEELEKLEQSITLTLQEIDHNFSRAHRIVTSSILPIVEQYAEHSRQVWDGSKFWKQFFESSANVSLSGYEEQLSTHESLDETVTEESSENTRATLEGSESYATPSSANHSIQQDEEDMDFSSLTMSPSHSTPRPQANGKMLDLQQLPLTYADFPSPYETLRQEVKERPGGNQHQAQPAPSTPRTSSTITDQIRDISVTPGTYNTTSFFLRRDEPTSIPRPSTTRKRTDPLLHRVLDRNYRVQATPMANPQYGGLQNPRTATGAGGIGAAGKSTPRTAARARLRESTLSSSPDVPEPPQLHPDIFSSPVRKTRTPGVSALTPRNPNTAANQRNLQRPSARADASASVAGLWDSDDEDLDADYDDDGGLPFGQSPPKTMQFHIPQSRLLKTPAREASKRIVEDLLQSAGISSGSRRRRHGTAGNGDDDEDNTTDDLVRLREREMELEFGDSDAETTSPSVVRKGRRPLEHETF